MIRDGDSGRYRVLAVVDGTAIELGNLRTRAEAERAEEQARAIEQAGPDCAAVFASRWLDEFPRPSPRSNKQMNYMIRAFTREFGARPLDDVTPREARIWANENHFAAHYAHRLYEDAIKIGLAEHNPFRGIRHQVGRTRVAAPTEAEVKTMIEAMPTPFAEAAGFAAFTGVRVGELLGLLGSDVSENGLLLHVERQWRVQTTKNYHSRTIAILPQARAYLPETHAEVRLFPLTPAMLGLHWRRTRRRLGLAEYPLHSLRHFCATWLLNLGASPVDISLQLGHRDGGRLVQELYGHPDDAISRDRLRRIAQAD